MDPVFGSGAVAMKVSPQSRVKKSAAGFPNRGSLMAEGMQERKLSTKCRRRLLRLEGVEEREREAALWGVVGLDMSSDACDDAWLLLADVEAASRTGSARADT